MKKKKKKKNFHEKYDKLFHNIISYNSKYCIPTITGCTAKNIKTDSWFNITEKYTTNTKNFNLQLDKNISDISHISRKIKFFPTTRQKNILLKWMDSYIDMYNATIRLFKEKRFNRQTISLQWQRVRTDYLKNIKQNIINDSQLPCYNTNTKVNSHVLDGAIKEVCKNYKSCLTNLKNGNITHFRLRYIKYTKPTKIIQIEKNFISSKKNTFCSTIFPNDFKFSAKFDLKKHINNDFLIQYDNKTNEFFLINPIKNNKIKTFTPKKKTISLDPGIRTFLMGFSNKKCVDICSNLKKKLNKYLKKISNVANKSKCIIKKVNRHYYRKIKNVINDMHWKVINYLTRNYDNIIIGNMSTKNIVVNRVGNYLHGRTKQIGLMMRLYVFKQRLQYKCNLLNIGYSEVDEAYTSKTCTVCGYENKKTSKKLFKCEYCNYKIDRDVNGARNIMLKATFTNNKMKKIRKIEKEWRNLNRQ